MELIDIVRSDYGYCDEYILEKSFAWLYNAVALIERRTYDGRFSQAILIGQVVQKLFGGKQQIKTYDELGKPKVWIEEGTSDNVEGMGKTNS